MLPKELEEIRAHIEKHDRLITLFNMTVLDVEVGRAVVKMEIGEDHLNAANLCHGGAIFSLADVAFALACNSHGSMALALEVSANYVRPARLSEVITAEAKELHQGRRTGVYFIEVRNQDGKHVAFFKATSYRVDQT